MTGDFKLPTMSFVIPHFTNAERTLELARKISESLKDANSEIVIVDDASPDGSAEAIAAHVGTFGIKLAVNEKNYGFGATVNRGAALSGGEILFVVNSDIEFCDAFSPMKIAMESARLLENEKIGAVMPLVYNTALSEVENLNYIWPKRGLLWLKRLDDSPKYTRYAARLTSGDLSETEGDAALKEANIESVLCGAFFAMRRFDFLRLGGFDTRFSPYYWEDVELGTRIGETGMMVVATPAATVLHAHGKSIERAANEEAKWKTMLKNQAVYSAMWGAKYGLSLRGFWLALRALRSAAKGDFETAGVYFGKVL